MDFGRVFAGVGASFNRVVQKTQESIGKAEKTEYDSEILEMMKITDEAKKWTEKIIQDLEAKLQPNPALRMQEFFFEKLDAQSQSDRKRPSDTLGETMQAAGAELDATTAYGHGLICTGKTETHLGATETEFVKNSTKAFIVPLQHFLKVEIASIMKERDILGRSSP